MMLRILQMTLVVMFALIVSVGVSTALWGSPTQWKNFVEFLGVILPVFITMMIPAFFGGPLSEGVRNLTAKSTPGNGAQRGPGS